MNVQKVFLQIKFLRKVMIALFATELGFNIAFMHHMSVQKFIYRVRTLTVATFERSSGFYTNQNVIYYSIITVMGWMIRNQCTIAFRAMIGLRCRSFFQFQLG